MAVERIPIEKILPQIGKSLIIDVRSPSEFAHAHIPGAISLPVFNDEERKVIGTTYKQKSRELAVKIGLDYFGPKMRSIVETVEKQLSKSGSRTVYVHCWRGGMRSGAIAWLLDFFGFHVYVLDGGYKAFRNWCLKTFDSDYHLRVLSGCTGSGKTEILHAMRKKEAFVIDLEGLANHKGSAFGDLGMPEQPSTEMFENLLALELFHLPTSSVENPIWVESESSRIGKVNLHHVFFNKMKVAPRTDIVVPFSERVNKIFDEYGHFSVDDLKIATLHIQRHMGGAENQKAISFLEEGKIKAAFEVLTAYYDRLYKKSTFFNPVFDKISLESTDAEKNATIILKK